MKVKDFWNNLIHDRLFRWYIFAGVSFLASFAFAIYNLVIGIIFRLVWNFSVSFYYLFLMTIKAIILHYEYKWKDDSRAEIQRNRLTLLKVENIFLLLIDLALIAPIVLMVLQEKQTVNVGMIPAITMAAYTTYKIVTACINYNRSGKTDNLALYGLKIISLKEAIVSIITLQNTMVVVFGSVSDMWTLTTWTTGGMFALILGISIYQLIKFNKIKKKENTPA